MASNEVRTGGLDVVPDRDTVEKHGLCTINDELSRVEEGLAHGLELGDVVGADFLAVLQCGSNLGDELTKLINAGSNLVEGAVFEVLDSGGHVGDEWVDILDASLKAINVLFCESTDEDAINELNHLKNTHSVLFISVREDVIPTTAPVTTALAIVFALVAPITIRPKRAGFTATIKWRSSAASSLFLG